MVVVAWKEEEGAESVIYCGVWLWLGGLAAEDGWIRLGRVPPEVWHIEVEVWGRCIGTFEDGIVSLRIGFGMLSLATSSMPEEVVCLNFDIEDLFATRWGVLESEDPTLLTVSRGQIQAIAGS